MNVLLVADAVFQLAGAALMVAELVRRHQPTPSDLSIAPMISRSNQGIALSGTF